MVNREQNVVIGCRFCDFIITTFDIGNILFNLAGNNVFILVIWVFAPLAECIPLCALAAILFVVAYNMSDVPHFYYMLTHAPRPDIVVQMGTFVLTIFTNLVIAVNVGVILAILLFIRRMSQAVTVEEEHMNIPQEEGAAIQSEFASDTIVYSLQGPFFFGAAEKIERILAFTHSDPQRIIFRLNHVPFMDITGLQIFREIIEDFHHRGVRIYLCEANPAVQRKLTKIGIHQSIEKGIIFPSYPELLKDLQTHPIHSRPDES